MKLNLKLKVINYHLGDKEAVHRISKENIQLKRDNACLCAYIKVLKNHQN